MCFNKAESLHHESRFFKASLYSEADLSWDTKQADLQSKCFLESSEFKGSLSFEAGFYGNSLFQSSGIPAKARRFLKQIRLFSSKWDASFFQSKLLVKSEPIL